MKRTGSLLEGFATFIPYLEDHPSGCKWLITMVSFRPLSRVGLVINGLFMAYTWGLVSRDDPPSRHPAIPCEDRFFELF